MKEIYRVIENRGNRYAKLDIQVSTYDELPELGELFENFFIQAGSHAEVVKAGKFATLDADGCWYVDGVAVAGGSDDTNKALSMSPTLKKAVDESDGDTIDLTEDDIDKISDELGLEPFPEPVEEKKSEPTEGGDDE